MYVPTSFLKWNITHKVSHNSDNADVLAHVADWYSVTNKKRCTKSLELSTVYFVFSVCWLGLGKWKQSFPNFLYFSNAYIRICLDEKCVAVAEKIVIFKKVPNYETEMLHYIVAMCVNCCVRSRSVFLYFAQMWFVFDVEE